MRSKWMSLCLAACLSLGTAGAYAAEQQNVAGSSNKSLEQAFNELSIIPYNYAGKAFIQGQKRELGGDYQVVQRNGRVLVPIRLMGYLAEQSTGPNQGMWEVIWEAKKPEDITLRNVTQKKSVKFKLNSKTMLVNEKQVALDVPAQMINGRVMLPLRDAGVALGKQITWLNGLILIGDGTIDVKHPQTQAVQTAIMKQLTDSRKPIVDDKVITPLTRYNNANYYTRTFYRNNGSTLDEQLFRQTPDKKNVQVEVPGQPVFNSAKVIGEDLYYVSKVNDEVSLYAYSFATLKPRKIASLGIQDLSPGWGWLTDVQKLDGELYINLHSGDLTMGHDTLYLVKNGALQQITTAKSVLGLVKDQANLYYTDFRFMSGPTDNISRVDTLTGEQVELGEPGYVYGIIRHSMVNGGVGYTGDDSLTLRDGSLYALGFKDSDPEDVTALYRISSTERKHEQIVANTQRFWVVQEQIYYLDGDTGALMRAGLDGSNLERITPDQANVLKIYDNLFYYTVEGNQGTELYRYNPANGQATKLAGLPGISDSDLRLYIGKTGIYYIADGYAPGIYKLGADGSSQHIVKDTIGQAVLSEAGLVYSLMYQEGVYSVK
ncbi:stalk domain-containing protein [Paenibacillus senegalimassiliensis]|uniref:stalk domain-containing protein n=1 Tax=Paenibacillus senegalimassiliensis TaxID=1737426 RepID=UPI00073E533B|nr:stalk domain-containing protein [Paenibacillus senegalimassiliensis]